MVDSVGTPSKIWDREPHISCTDASDGGIGNHEGYTRRRNHICRSSEFKQPTCAALDGVRPCCCDYFTSYLCILGCCLLIKVGVCLEKSPPQSISSWFWLHHINHHTAASMMVGLVYVLIRTESSRTCKQKFVFFTTASNRYI